MGRSGPAAAPLPEDAAARLGEGEQWARRQGFHHVIGVDEVGRGPLAGPVVAAAVRLPGPLEAALVASGLDDSKGLTPRRRASLAARIEAEGVVGLGEASPERIDAINILNASLEAMATAVSALPQAPLEEMCTPSDQAEGGVSCVLVDGNRPLEPCPLPGVSQYTMVQGDRRAICIAAASVVAKVRRDTQMAAYARTYPGYGLERNKGYPSREHLEALRRLGPTPIHRRSFRGVVT